MKRTITALTVTVLLLVGTTAWASGRFVDVPADHPHQAGIEWMADSGLTGGCNPPANDLFCPDRPVTRAELATILRRATLEEEVRQLQVEVQWLRQEITEMQDLVHSP